LFVKTYHQVLAACLHKPMKTIYDRIKDLHIQQF